MVRAVLAGLLTFVLQCPVGHAADEGVYIEQEVVHEAVSGQPAMKGVQKTWLTSGLIRNQITVGDNTTIAIIDLDKDRVFLIPSDEKQYVRMNLQDFQKIIGQRLAGAGLGERETESELIRTGDFRTIGTWLCERYAVRLQGKMHVRSELWVTKDVDLVFADYLQLMERLGMKKLLPGLVAFAESIEGYPVSVRTEMSQQGQRIVSTHQVVKIAKGPVDPSLFEIPEGYELIENETLTRQK